LRHERDKWKGKYPPNKKKIQELNDLLEKLSKGYSDLTKNLKERIETTSEDLKIILDSQKLLSDLRLLELPSFLEVGRRLEKLLEVAYEKMETNAEYIPDYSTWKVFEISEGRHRKYWLSTNEEKKPTAKDIFSPTFAIPGIKGIWTAKLPKSGNINLKVATQINVRKILCEALDLSKRFPDMVKKYPILHPQENKAKEILWIKSRIELFKEKCELENSKVTKEKISIKPHVTMDEYKEEFPEFIERYQVCATLKNEVEKILAEKLLQSGFSLKKIGVILPISKEDKIIWEKINRTPKT